MNEELTELQLENEDDGDGTAAQNSISLVAGDSEIFRLLSDFRFLRRTSVAEYSEENGKRISRRVSNKEIGFIPNCTRKRGE